jgi:predicted permease
MQNLLKNLRYGLRQLGKNPGFTVVALITLALSLGANLTIFAVVDSILLRPLPFPEPDRLVLLYSTYPTAGKARDLASLRSYFERRGNIPAFSQLAALNAATAVVGEAGSTERMDIGRVTPEFFSTLGVPLAMGRSFTDAEMTYQTDQEAILTDSYWRHYFNADPHVLGRYVRTDGLLRRVVGVLPPSYSFLSSKAQVFLPLSSEDSERNLQARHANTVIEIARLNPGATLAEAQAQVDAQNAAHAAEFPFAKEVAAAGFRTIVTPLHADHVALVRPTVLLLQAGALFLLLIGAVNLVNLLLIRSSARVKELAIRQSMGASRWNVVSQVMTETVLLALMGGVCGMAVGAGGIRLLMVLGADQLPLGANIAFDGQLAAVALLGSVALGVLIALPIAWYSLRGVPASALQSESRSGTTSRSAHRLRHGFIVAQITLAFMLLSGAGLLGLSLKRVMALSTGFRSDHVLTGQFSLPWNSYHTGQSFLVFTDRLLDNASHQPGISAVGGVTGVPLSGEHGTDAITAVGYNPTGGESVVLHPTLGVFGDYFTAMGIPLRAGRYLTNADNHRSERPVVVDEVFAHRYWPQGNAVGQRVFSIPRKPDDSNVYTVVGVVGAVKQIDLTEADGTGTVYFPYIYTFSRNYFLVARTSLPPELLGDTLRRVVRQTDADIPLTDLRSMETRIDDSLMTRRSPALLTGIFAGVALLLAAIGTYGVLSFAVSQRSREIGIRMALGAQPQQVLAGFLGLGARLLLVGVVLGVLGAWAAGRAMESVLYGVGAFQLGVFAATSGVMMLVVLLACYIPARRAAKVDPMVALRCE